MSDEITLTSPLVNLAFSAKAGGCLTSFKALSEKGFVDLMRPATSQALKNNDPQGMACFMSIPYVGRINQGRFVYKGRTYNLAPNQEGAAHPLHGIIWRRPAIIEKISNEGVVITHHILGKDTPYQFLSRQTWILKENSLHINIEVQHLGVDDMPYGIGLHPFFKKSGKVTIQSGVGAMIVNDQQVMPKYLKILEPSQDFSKNSKNIDGLLLDNCFVDWDRQCRIDWIEHGISLHMNAGPLFDYFVFCNPVDTDWFCANPVTHFNNAHNNPIGLPITGLVNLKQGESLTGDIVMTVEVRSIKDA